MEGSPEGSELRTQQAIALDAGLLEAMPGGVVQVGADGAILAANAEAQRVLGLSFDELTRAYVADFETQTMWEDGSACPAHEYPVSRALATGQPQGSVTLGVRRPDGGVSWAVFRALPIRDPIGGAVTGAIVTFLDITERKRVEEELARNRELLRKAQEIAKVGSWEWDIQSGAVAWTEQMYEIHGVERGGFSGDITDALRYLHPDDREQVETLTRRVVEQGVTAALEYRIVRPNGDVRTVWGGGELIRDENGQPIKLVGAIQDVTEQRDIEAQLRHSQRMESVGQLAGGVAHDFNNLLQVILGNAEIALRNPRASGTVREIKMAADRAAELTRQLLAFGRQQSFHPVELDPADLVRGLRPLLQRMLGERVRVDFEPTDAVSVYADRGQLEQVLMNLCINARDAMPEGGRIVLRIEAVEADAAFRHRHGWASAGRFAALIVEDDGTGMEPDVRARALEPFFTTKAYGAGTGLGLSVVYGIARQHGGMVELHPRPGQGTRVEVYLPATDRPPVRRSSWPDELIPTGNETVLVVEDEAMVRSLVVELLQAAGYTVMSAPDGEEALKLFDQHAERIHLVLSDLVMPGMDGVELGRRVRERRTDARILFTTGYAAGDDGEYAGDAVVLQKPYTSSTLLKTVREMLDEAPRGAAR